MLQYHDAILTGLAGDITDETRRIIDRCSLRLRDLTCLVDDWLALSGLDEARITSPDARVEVDLSELVRSLVSEHRPRLDIAGQKVVLHCTGGLPLLNVHRGTIVQILDNILSNAIKYGKALGLIEIVIDSTDDAVVISVTDDGLGISPEHVPFLFDEFFRVNIDDSVTGTGLGLTIVRHFTEALGGFVEVESEPGAGSTFRIHLPKDKTSRLESETSSVVRGRDLGRFAARSGEQ